ncbi:MAG: NBR1-Ig-like domain-containing protein [Chloroflexota bacterium]
MRTQRKLLIPLLLTSILLLVTACGPTGTPDAAATFNPMVTAAAQTMEALLTQAANPPVTEPSATLTEAPVVLPTLTLEPTSTTEVSLTPSSTLIPSTATPTATTATRCDWASFIADVSVPDGTTFEPNKTFVKTWRLKNIGTCTWSSSYSLVFVSGEQMGGKASIALPGNVAPNQSIDLSVTLTAPATEKSYTGYWMLKNTSGTLFGFGPTASSSFWVNIKVANPVVTSIAYDFVDNYCDAAWKSDAGAITCNTTSGAGGFVTKLTSPRLETSTAGTEAAILTHPQAVNDGYIIGTYPAFTVQSGDRFQANLGCQYGSTACFVRFRLDYKVGTDPVKNLGIWDEKLDSKYTAVNVDLSSLAGKSVVFYLKVLTLGSPDQDDALWQAARIMRSTPKSSNSCALVSQKPTDNTTFKAGTDFDTTWTVKNTGTFDWRTDTVDFVYVSGTKMHKPAYGDIRDLAKDVAKNGTIALTVDMLAPATSGTYSETWALKNGNTTLCTMFVTIKVVP